MRAEMPQIAQAIGTGTASSRSRVPRAAGTTGAAGVGSAAFVIGAGTLRTLSGVDNSGCVFAIFTVAPGGAAGSGRMLMRAVSFFGPDWVPEPG